MKILIQKMITHSVLFLIIFSGQALHAEESYELVVNQSENRLFVKKDGVTVRSFHVALGSGGHDGKQVAGDRKTPLGEYRIMKVRDSSRFFMFMQLNYPSVRDAARALKSDVISKQQYRSILDAHIEGRLPPQNTKLGGAIGIHGIGEETKDKIEIHELADWTQGCIALRNNDIEYLKSYVHIGTKVRIVK